MFEDGERDKIDIAVRALILISNDPEMTPEKFDISTRIYFMEKCGLTLADLPELTKRYLTAIRKEAIEEVMLNSDPVEIKSAEFQVIDLIISKASS